MNNRPSFSRNKGCYMLLMLVCTGDITRQETETLDGLNKGRDIASNETLSSDLNKTANAPASCIDLKVQSDEFLLLKMLFEDSDYDSDSRPVYDHRRTVQVEFGLTLIQIMDLDESGETLTTNVWLEHSWNDERISWDPEEYGGITIIRVHQSFVWLPDIMLYNSADDFTSEYMPTNVMIHFDGNITWPPPARLQSACAIKAALFPFDTQNCSLRFMSWMYDISQINLTMIRAKVELSDYVTNGEWDLFTSDILRHEFMFTSRNAVYSDVTVYIVIHRRILYLAMYVLMPCISLNVVGALNLSLMTDEGEKITLSITLLLSWVFTMMMVAGFAPSTSDAVPLISMYVFLSMAMTSFTVIVTVLVHMGHQSHAYQDRAPAWLRKSFLIWIARLIRYDHLIKPQTRNNKVRQKTNYFEHKEVTTRLLERNLPDTLVLSGLGDAESTAGAEINVNEEDGMRDLAEYLMITQGKKATADSDIDIRDEWTHIILVLDRFMFYVYSAVITLSTVILFVIIPETNTKKYHDGE